MRSSAHVFSHACAARKFATDARQALCAPNASCTCILKVFKDVVLLQAEVVSLAGVCFCHAAGPSSDNFAASYSTEDVRSGAEEPTGCTNLTCDANFASQYRAPHLIFSQRSRNSKCCWRCVQSALAHSFQHDLPAGPRSSPTSSRGQATAACHPKIKSHDVLELALVDSHMQCNGAFEQQSYGGRLLSKRGQLTVE